MTTTQRQVVVTWRQAGKTGLTARRALLEAVGGERFKLVVEACRDAMDACPGLVADYRAGLGPLGELVSHALRLLVARGGAPASALVTFVAQELLDDPDEPRR